jgi:hypothetical protein
MLDDPPLLRAEIVVILHLLTSRDDCAFVRRDLFETSACFSLHTML